MLRPRRAHLSGWRSELVHLLLADCSGPEAKMLIFAGIIESALKEKAPHQYCQCNEPSLRRVGDFSHSLERTLKPGNFVE